MSRKADFRCLERLGCGSFGKVDKVRRLCDGEVVVLKQVSMVHFKTEKARQQALSEASIMKKLDCPHIVEYMDAFIEKGCLFLILQYCDMGDLKSFLKNAKQLPNRSIWRIFLRIALGLQYLHNKRILHRDLKSENIFLAGTEDGVRVGDLGLAKMLPDTQTGASTLVGTPRYLSPEEVRGLAHYNAKCDVWSLGIILYELCSEGHRGPFDQADRLPQLMKAILEEEPKTLPQRHEEFQEVANVQLRKDPQQRFSMTQVLAMERVVENAEKSGVNQEASSGSHSASNTPILGSGLSLQQQLQSRRDPGYGRAERPANPEGTDEGCLNRCAVALGFSQGEPALGPRFKRLTYCELCHAEGMERSAFSFFVRRHHCRSCGRSVCEDHSRHRRSLPHFGHTGPQRICPICSHLPADGAEAPSTRLMLVAVAEKAYVWDTSSVAAASWSSGEQLRWAGLSSSSSGKPSTALCTLESQAGSVFNFRTLDRLGRELPKVTVPKAGGCTAEVQMAACSGQWVAASLVSRAGATISIVDVGSGKEVGQCSAAGEVSALALHSGDEGFMVTGSDTGPVRVWGVPGCPDICELRCVLKGHKEAVLDIAVCAGERGDANFICTGSKDNTVRLWKRQKGSRPSSPKMFAAHSPALCEEYRPTGPSSLCCDGPRLAFVQTARKGGYEQRAAVWNLAVGKLERSFGKKGHSVNCVALCGTVLATSSSAKTNQGCVIQLWHVSTGTALSSITNPAQVTYLLLAEPEEEKSAAHQR